MNKFVNNFINILLVVFITLLFLTLIMILFIANKEILTGKSNLIKFINIVTLCSIVIGGILSVLNNQLNILIYICILFSLFQCLFELIQNKA